MALRKYMVLLPCAMLFVCASYIGAEDTGQEEATEVEQQELSLIDQIRQALDEESQAKLDALLGDIQGLSGQLQDVQPELESRHAEIVAQLKELLGIEQIPFNLTLVLSGDQQQAVDEERAE